jgi:hypothetical protein
MDIVKLIRPVCFVCHAMYIIESSVILMQSFFFEMIKKILIQVITFTIFPPFFRLPAAHNTYVVLHPNYIPVKKCVTKHGSSSKSLITSEKYITC